MEARELAIVSREAGVSARERNCRALDADLHARWVSVEAERKQVAEVGSSSSVDRYMCV